MMLAPMFTMRLIAEERRNQTFTLLLSAPLSSRHIVLGKFFGLLVFLAALMTGVPLMLYTLMFGTALDHGLLLSNMLGLLLLTASYVAVGLYVSALTTQPVIAAIGALAVLVGLWLADIGAAGGEPPRHPPPPSRSSPPSAHWRYWSGCGWPTSARRQKTRPGTSSRRSITSRISTPVCWTAAMPHSSCCSACSSCC